MAKTCVECITEKPLADFHKNKNLPDGHCNQCKECRQECSKNANYKVSVTEKKCSMCLKTKAADKFSKSKHNKSGLQNACKECDHIKMVKYYENGGIDKFFIALFRDLKHNAERRKIQVDITIDDLKELFSKQNGLCALSKDVMTWDKYTTNNQRMKNFKNISVDRIDPKGTYAKDNIQLLCSQVNQMKWDLTQTEFITFCRKVTDNFQEI